MSNKLLRETFCIVTWNDASSQDTWETTDSFRAASGLVKCETIGFLLEETPEEIKLVRTCHEDGSYSEGMFSIPKGMIISIEKRKRTKPRKPKQPPV
jgi:hypothetical protein